MKSKNLLLAILAVFVVGVIAIGLYYPEINGGLEPSETLSPSEAYLLCNQESCITEEVTIRGNMARDSTTYGRFSLSDESKIVYIDLQDSGMSLIDTILFHEKTNLEKDGIVEVEVSGFVQHEKGMCTMSGCLDLVRMNVEPEKTEVVKRVGCKSPDSGKSRLEPGDCFDVSYRKIELEAAYRTLFSSGVCTERGRTPSRGFAYDVEEDRWIAGIVSDTRPGGCSEVCQIFEDKVVFERTCAVGGPGTGRDLYLEEEVIPKSIEELYGECVEKSSVGTTRFGPAKDEPVGATREDEMGNIWTKQGDDEWTSQGERVKATTWGDEMIDELAGGIKTYPLDCDAYLKKSLQT